MKNVFVNGKYLSQPVTGVQRFAAGVVHAWDRDLEEGIIDSSYSVRVIAPKTISKEPQYKKIEIVRSNLDGRLWEQAELPWRSRGGLLFSPYAAAPLFKSRHMVTIHDAGVRATPMQYSRAFRLYYSALYYLLGKTCTRIFTVSQFSKQELCKYFSMDDARIKVVYPGCEHIREVEPDFRILTRFALDQGNFVLGVSSRSPIKNFRGLAEAWKHLGAEGMKLVVAGGYNARVFGAEVAALEANIIFLGYVSDAELAALYRTAALFVYPSFYEGFGLPPIEAMACGCPVLVANSSSLPEVCGGAALYCNPADAWDISEKMGAVLRDFTLAQELKSKGKERAEGFTSQSCARAIWATLSRDLSDRHQRADVESR